MDISERLAAFAAGELGPDEHRALEAELARDPSLRAELAAIRSVDRLLASLEPVAPPADFSARLRDTLRAELAEHANVVSLEAARSRRDRWRRPMALTAAAAAMLGVVGVGINSLGSSSDEAALDVSTGFAQDSLEGPSTQAEMAAPAGGSAMGGPVYAEGGRYDKGTVGGIGDREDVRAALAEAAFDPLGARTRNLDLLTSIANNNQRNGGGTGMQEASPEGDAPAAAIAEDSTVSSLDNVISRCVPMLLDADRVPLFVDLGSFEDQDALIVVLGSRDANGDFGRLEYWVLAPDDDCRTLYFAQDG